VGQTHIGLVPPLKYKPKRISMKVVNNLIIIPVTVFAKNDTLALNFLLDTGVKTSLIFDHEFEDHFSADEKRLVKVRGLGPKEAIEATLIFNTQMQIGDCKGDHINMIVLPENSFKISQYLGLPVHGVIGYDLFDRFAVEIDYVQEYIKLHKTGDFKVRKRYRKLPIEIIDSKPVLSASCIFANQDTVELKFMVDTGASLALTFDQFSHENIELPNARLNHSYLGSGLSGDLHGEVGRIQQIQLSDFTFNSVVSAFPDSSSIAHMLDKQGRNGLIGGEIWKRFRVVFDYPQKCMYLRKNGNYRKQFDFNKSGMLIVAEGPDLANYVISCIDIGSAAEEAGLLEGDVILAISSAQFDGLSLDKIYKILHDTPSGRKLTLFIARGEEILKVSMKLRSAI